MFVAMRKIFKSIMLVAAAAMTFASCQKEIATPGSISTTLTLHAGVESTKTYLGEDKTVLWGPDEVVKLYVGSGEEAKFISSTKTSDFNGSSTASFTFSIDGVTESESYTLGGVYPASISDGINSNNNPVTYKVQLPATQNSVNGGYDPKAYMMVIRPEEVSELPEEFEGYFRRATALNKVTLTNVVEDITSVEISVPEKKYLAGRRNINLTTGESGEIYDSGTQTNVVKVTGDFKVNEGVIEVWFCSWEVELVADDVLSVKLSSDKNTYTHSVTLKDDESIKFKEGYLNTLSVNMKDAKVEALSTITGKYLIASMTSSGWFLMTPTNGGKFYTATSSVSSASEVTCDDFYEVSDVDDYVWEVAKYDNAYSIMSTSTNKYVAYKNSSNEAYANTDLSNEAKMDIKLDGKAAVIESMNVAGRKLQYNASSPRFAFYTTTQTPVYMIPWVPDTTPKILVDGVNTKNISYEGGDLTFNYTLKNLDGETLNMTVSNSDMLSASAADGVLAVTVSANEGEAREATITLTCGEAAEVVLTVTQSEYVEPGQGGGTKTISFKLDKTVTGSTSTSYVQNETTFTYDGIQYAVNNWNPSTLQIRGNQTSQSNMQSGKNFYLRNKTAIPGKITSIKVEYTSGSLVATSIYAVTSTSQITNQTTSASKKGTAATNAVTWDFDANGGYFAIGMQKGGTSGTALSGTITITYEAN